MPSRYDEKKKCRFGTMDEGQFYNESDQKNGKYFKSLMAKWKKSAGDNFKGKSMISIVDPGELSAAKQKSLTDALCKLI